jgi:prepilin-type N-terminal cleavage/methylation domain-containing protein
MAMSSIRPARPSGFTLVELLIVVVILGVLSSIAIPLFLSYQLRSRTAEGKTNLAAIRTLESARFSEYDAYLKVAPEPPLIPGSSAVSFNVAGSFAPLGFSPEGRVLFSYGVAVSADGGGYTADAGADLDADGFVQFWGFAKPDLSGTLTAGRVGCNAAGLQPQQVGPCDPTHGTSVF